MIELDFSGGLWRGEENRPYRGEVKGPLDVARVTRKPKPLSATGKVAPRRCPNVSK